MQTAHLQTSSSTRARVRHAAAAVGGRLGARKGVRCVKSAMLMSTQARISVGRLETRSSQGFGGGTLLSEAILFVGRAPGSKLPRTSVLLQASSYKKGGL